VFTTIINIHLIALVTKGKEAFKLNKLFYLIVMVVASSSIIPVVIGIVKVIYFPYFSPSHDLVLHSMQNVTSNRLDFYVTDTTETFIDALVLSSKVLSWGTFVFSSILWIFNLISFIWANKALHQYYQRYLLFDADMKKEFGVDISLRIVSTLLIGSQLPGILFGGWLFFMKEWQWHNPIVLQCCFGFGSSMQGMLNGIYYMFKREVRQRFWYLLRKCFCSRKYNVVNYII